MKRMTDLEVISAPVYVREIREQLHAIEQTYLTAEGFKDDEWVRQLRGALCNTSTALQLIARHAIARVREK